MKVFREKLLTKKQEILETFTKNKSYGMEADGEPSQDIADKAWALIEEIEEAGGMAKAIETGIVPPTINLDEPDPRCDLDHVPNEPRDLNSEGGVDVCLSNGFGFGGQNDTVCVRRFR